MSSKTRYILSLIGSGYSGVFFSLIRLILFLVFLGVVSGLLTFPLWYWALHARTSFTIFVLLILLGATIYFLIRKGFDFIGRKRREGLSFLSIARIPLERGGRVVVLLFFLYAVVTLVAHSQFLAAGMLALAAFFVLGFLFFAR